MFRGRIVANLRRDETEHNDIGLYMAGAKEQPVKTDAETTS
jgi:hypothetical protein